MRFSVASGTDNSLLQAIALSNADIELHTHEIDNNTRPYGIEGLLQVLKSYGPTSQGPHTFTQRWVYTVPSNKVARLDLCTIGFQRWNASTTASQTSVTLIVDAVSVGKRDILHTQTYDSDNLDPIIQTITPRIILVEGDELEFVTYDDSIGGVVYYWGHAYISQVDA